MREKQPPLKPPLRDKYEMIWLEIDLLSALCEKSRRPCAGEQTPVRSGHKMTDTEEVYLI